MYGQLEYFLYNIPFDGNTTWEREVVIAGGQQFESVIVTHSDEVVFSTEPGMLGFFDTVYFIYEEGYRDAVWDAYDHLTGGATWEEHLMFEKERWKSFC